MSKTALWVAIVAVTFVSAWAALSLRSTRAWPIAEGKIVQSQINTQKIQRLSFSNSDSFTNQFEVALTYEYTVSGKQFVGHALFAKAPAVFGREDTAKKMQAQFAAGKSAPVFYDPATPSRSWLVNSSMFPISGYLALLVGLVLLLALIVLAVGLPKKTSPTAKPRMQS